jgi:Ca-activated chloride channel family protein
MEMGGFEVRTVDRNEMPTYGAAPDRPAALAMQRLWVTGQILPVGARVLVQHTFRNGEERPLEVVYAFMLPRDAALRRFEVRGDGFEAHSELRKVEEAVKEYEEGIDAGNLSTLARSYRDGVVNLSLGNLKKGDDVTVTLEILAGVELRDDGLRFRFPFKLAPGYHPRARMIDNAGSGEIELPSSEFGDVILPPYKRTADGLHEVGFDLALRIPGDIAEVGSPSHAIRVRNDHGAGRVTLAPESDVPNRDLVLDVRVANQNAIVLAGEKHFAMAIPSTRFGMVAASPQKVALVIDRSGSMQGQPMTQARRAVEACLGALSEEDEFAIVAFDDQVETFRDKLVKATTKDRDDARAFMKQVDARGGTELARGFSAAAKLVAGGGDVLVVTDGQVMGTEEILAQTRSLGVRLHCLGIGSASQDRFLAQLASSTGGVSRMVTPQERVDVAAVDLFASIGRPVASGITVSAARFAVEPPDAVFGGTPWVAFGEIGADRKVAIAWKDGHADIDLPVTDPDAAETVRLLTGAKLIADVESRMTSPVQSNATLAEREQSRLERRLEQLSTEFRLASRAMALVAVVKRSGDVAGELPSTQVVPLGMPQGTAYDAYFGAPVAMAMMAAPTGGPTRGMALTGSYRVTEIAPDYAPAPAALPSGAPAQSAGGPLSRLKEMFSRKRTSPPLPPPPAFPYDAAVEELEVDTTTDRLLAIASTLAPDGGVPGSDLADRALKTVSAVLLFLSEGHTPTSGAFRAHVERMVRFLETVPGLSTEQRAIVDGVIEFARSGKSPKAAEVMTWDDVEEAIG